MIQFPEKFQERMQQMLGEEEYAEFLKSYDLPFHNGLRINTWKTKPQELLQRMGVDLKQVPWNETGFYLENKKQFSKHPYYQGGLYYIQEASAMLPAKLVNAQPGAVSYTHLGISFAVENGYGHEWLVMLNYQYRMHPEIAKFVSKNIYGNLLQSADSIYESRQMIADLAPMAKEPMSLVDLSFTYSVCVKTMDGSRINLMSAMMCVKIAEMFAGEYDVGIITPYRAQSRLILAMIRDLQERDERFKTVKCATVHQFQGSEKPIIIYDAVDCFSMPFPGTLLTSKRNDTANRLFNVAMSRAEGKFILVANKDYLFRKNISKDLMFTKALEYMNNLGLCIGGEDIFNQFGTLEKEKAEMFLGDRDEVDSCERFLEDIEGAAETIVIDMPGRCV